MGREAISRETFVKGLAAGVIAAASLGSLYYTQYSTSGGDYDFVPGKYSGTAKGMESDVKVTITVDKHAITDASVDVSGETPGIGAEISDETASQILDMQVPEIDGVAGATVSSGAVREALAQAIEKAEAGEADPEGEEAATEEVIEAAGEENTDLAVENTSENGNDEAAEAVSGSSAGMYVPGTYTASAKGMESNVKVSITFTEDAITAAGVDVSGETPDVGAAIGPDMENAILNAQSAEIDSVSGATITSEAVKAAVGIAIEQARTGGGADSAPSSGKSAANEAEAADGAAAEGSSSTAGSSYTPGTYTATAPGMESDVSVSMQFTEDKITAVGIDVSGETPDVGAAVGPELSAAIMAAQSADIDAASGATVTSEAVMAAARSCIDQALGLADADLIDAAQMEAGSAEPEEAVTEALVEAAEAAAEENTSSAAAYTPGTYSATIPGDDGGDVTVAITFSSEKITAVGINIRESDPALAAQANIALSKAFLAEQTAEVANLPEAEALSETIKDAARDCIEQAAK